MIGEAVQMVEERELGHATGSIGKRNGRRGKRLEVVLSVERYQALCRMAKDSTLTRTLSRLIDEAERIQGHRKAHL